MKVPLDRLGSDDKLKYFAYGSNLRIEQMKDRCDDYRAEPTTPRLAKAIGWRLHFPRYEKSRNGGVASIERDDTGVVWGVVYELTVADWHLLNRSEEYDPTRDPQLNSYNWRTITVTTVGRDGEDSEEVGTYIATIDQEHLPSATYIDIIIAGARERKLPIEYIRELMNLQRIAAPGSSDMDVAIVGGGIAGLYCAYKLRYKKRFWLFEATERIGGRIWSTRILDGKPATGVFDSTRLKDLDFCAEFGPMRIELEQQQCLSDLLTKDLGITKVGGDFEPFPPYGSPTSEHDPKYELRDEEIEHQNPMDLMLLAFARILNRLRVPTSSDDPFWPKLDDGKSDGTGREAREFRACLDEALSGLRVCATGSQKWKKVFRAWIDKLEEPDYQNFRKYAVFEDGTKFGTPLYAMGFWNLLTDVLSHHAVMKIRDFGTFYHLINENPNAVVWLIFWLRGLKTSQTMKGVVGGMERIPEELRKRIPLECVWTSSKLVGISLSSIDPTRVTLQFGGKAATETIATEHVILALPKAPLEELVVTNAAVFDQQTCDDLDSVFGFPMVKLFFIVTKRWWPKNTAKWTNRYATLLPTRELHFISSRRHGSKRGMVLIYTDRPASAFLANYVLRPGSQEAPEWGSGKTNGRLMKKALQYLRESGNRSTTEDNFELYGIRDWGRRPYSGANHAWRPERQSWRVLRRLSAFALAGSSVPSQKNIHVCGEAYSDYHGFMEGALRSAAHVLHTIDNRGFRTKTPWLCPEPERDWEDHRLALPRPCGQSRPPKQGHRVKS